MGLCSSQGLPVGRAHHCIYRRRRGKTNAVVQAAMRARRATTQSTRSVDRRAGSSWAPTERAAGERRVRAGTADVTNLCVVPVEHDP